MQIYKWRRKKKDRSQAKEQDLLFLYAPSLSTRTRSLSMTVGIRCAMVQTVHSLNSLRIIFCIRLSVAVSTDAVASSSTSILDCCSRARPRATSCRCPTLQLSPFSRTAGFKAKRSNRKQILIKGRMRT